MVIDVPDDESDLENTVVAETKRRPDTVLPEPDKRLCAEPNDIPVAQNDCVGQLTPARPAPSDSNGLAQATPQNLLAG